MAEFSEVMRQWRRMCNYETDEGMKDAQGCIRHCGLAHNATCGEVGAADDKELAEAERIIMAWAAEHPEPVYPTWAEYLMHIYQDVSYARILGETIPADIAQKLGIKPKEE